MDREMENLDDHGCPKSGDLGEPNEEKEFARITQSIKNKATPHCTNCKAKLLGNWTKQHLKLEKLYCAMFCQYPRK